MSLRTALLRKYFALRQTKMPKKLRFRFNAIVLLLVFAVSLCYSLFYFRKISTAVALSDANDIIYMAITEAINRKMAYGEYDYDYFVNLQKDNSGSVTAITTNVARINTLSSEILNEVLEATNKGTLDISVPIGTLTGFHLLQGKGPDIPVDIMMLTSSSTSFKNELTTASINQTKHQIILEIVVDIDVVVPWATESLEVVCEVLIAETVIVGVVPDTYVRLEQPAG